MQGNLVNEGLKSNWPYENCVFIVLKYTFIGKYSNLSSDIEYKETNDPHYCKSQYYDKTQKVVIWSMFDSFKGDIND